MMRLNVNMNAVVRFADQLGQMHRSALPVAVRSALNSAAFNVKQQTMPASAAETFTQRKPNFFKANSKVERATGFNIASMQSTVGFKSLGGNNQAVDELEQQEHGGTIDHRSLVPMDTARAGKRNAGMVRPNARLAALKDKQVINAAKGKAKSDKQKFVRAAIMAKKLYGDNAFVLGNRSNGRQTLSRIDKINHGKGNKTISIRRTPLYTFKKGGKVQVARTNFMKRAAMESGMKLEKYFVDEAIKQWRKAKK